MSVVKVLAFCSSGGDESVAFIFTAIHTATDRLARKECVF